MAIVSRTQFVKILLAGTIMASSFHLLLRLAQGPAPARVAREQALVRARALEARARVRVLAPRARVRVLERAPVRAARERVRAQLAPEAAPEVPAAAAGKPGSSARLSAGNNERQAPS